MHDGFATTVTYTCTGGSSSSTDVVISKADGTVTTRYLHVRIDPAIVGQNVSQGKIIGSASDLGCANTPHFMVYVYRGSSATLANAIDLSDPNGVLLDGEIVLSGTAQTRGGGTEFGTIYTYASMPRMRLVGDPKVSDLGQFEFTINGEVGRTYVIEASDDLVTWTLLQSMMSSNGSFKFVDNASLSFARRFYRVRVQ